MLRMFDKVACGVKKKADCSIMLVIHEMNREKGSNNVGIPQLPARTFFHLV